MNWAMSSLITRHTRISRSHLTPEVALRLITPECELWSARTPHPFSSDPFWAFYWPGGQALTRYVLDGASGIRDKKVLDVGSGCGACSIAAVKRGATILANDIDECAITALHLNAELNGVTLAACKEDLIGTHCEGFDTILIGDMFYDEEFANVLFKWLEELSKCGKTVLIGDPGRHGLTDRRRKHLKLLAKYSLREETTMENSGFRVASVWKLDIPTK